MKRLDADAQLRAFVARFPSRTAAAYALGISTQHLHMVMTGRCKPNDAVLEKLGLERVIIQRRKAS